MADVFLSYARRDHLVAERLADAITASGRTVWWDRHIKGGSEFSRDIERQLSDARYVLVLWSKDAVESRWVRDEASEAAENGRLVAATVDGTPPPLGFRQFHTIDLSGWSRRGATLPAELARALDVSRDLPSPERRAGPRVSRKIAAAVAGLLLLVAVAAVVLLPLGNGYSGLFSREDSTVTLAIMPFDVGGGEDLEYLGSGLPGALTSGLSRLGGLNLISTGSARAVAEENLTAKQIGTKLGASHLLEGEISPMADSVRIAVRLIDASSGSQLWAQNYTGLERDLGKLEFAIGKDLAAALQARLGVGRGAFADRGGVDPRAYEAYLKGLERVSTRHDVEARKEAVRQFELATSIDPDFADAHAGLAYILSLTIPPQLGMTQDELQHAQMRATNRALTLDPDSLLALTAKSNAHVNFTGATTTGIAIAKKVLKRAPDFGPAHYVLGTHLLLEGRYRESLTHFDRAIESDPYNQIQRLTRMYAYGMLGDYEAVRRTALECEIQCEMFFGHWIRTLADIGSPEAFERDFPMIADRLRPTMSPEAFAEMSNAVRGFVFNRPFDVSPVEDGARGYDFAAILARAGRLDDAFDVARFTAPRSQADEIVMIMSDGRLTFPPEARADPRYHALFRDFPHLRRIADIRRKNGVPGGLPIEPSQLEAEKRRLASKRR